MWRRLLVSLALLGLAVPVGGCSCVNLCDEPGERVELLGAVVSVDGGVATFRTQFDGDVAVRVDANVDALEVGETYRVGAVRRPQGEVELVSRVNGGCGSCDEVNITHPNGDRLDTGLWKAITETAFVRWGVRLFLVVPVLSIIGVVIYRLRRGPDHDPYIDLPDDGSWLEYDGAVDWDDDLDEPY